MRKIQLSLFIRDYLARTDASGHDIYIAYKDAVGQDLDPEFRRQALKRIKKAIVRARKLMTGKRATSNDEEATAWLPTYISGGPGHFNGISITWRAHRPKKKRCISYNGFMHYIYVLRQLGLVEYTGEEFPARGKAGSEPSAWHEEHPSVMLHAISGSISDPAWNNIWEAYQNK